MDEEFKVENYALVDQLNIVDNVISWNGDKVGNPYTPAAGLSIVGPLADGEVVGRGYIYDEANDTFMPPDPME